MKAHFIGALEGDKNDYIRIVKVIKNHGWEIVTDHSLERTIADVEKESPEESEVYSKKMMVWIKKADVVVVEVTEPGLGSGFEVATALELGKPVVVMYRPKPGNTPHVLKSLESEDKLQVLSYNDTNLEKQLETALDYACDTMDTRFNFFVSPKHQHYLDYVSKTRKVPRAVFLRRLIEHEMEQDQDYNA